MAPLGPFGHSPQLAVAVSGGPDSLALAVLAERWTELAGGSLTALVLDHGLRPEAAAEAELTASRLHGLGIRARTIRLYGLAGGSGVPARAREMRHAILEAAAAELGTCWLLFGHHLADQAETVLERVLSGSGPAGLAGMAGRRETARVALLRPLLGIPPQRLCATLSARQLRFVIDPSNADVAFHRGRLRGLRVDRAGEGAATAALGEAAAACGLARAAAEKERCQSLADRAALYPEGYARLSPGPIAPAALAALLRTLSGSAFAPSEARVSALARGPRPATLAGVRLLPAGRLGPGWLLVRERRAMAPPVAAIPGLRWDGRFRLSASARPPAGSVLGALGAAAQRLRTVSPLPAAVLCTLPALWLGGELVAVPHLGYPDPGACACVPVIFSPNEPAGPAPFVVVRQDGDAVAAR
ncbi:MAG: tRNA lysidine(34) synthetase TilS [Acetobacteraceae bacterium]